MTLDFGIGPLAISKAEVYLEDNRDTSRLDAIYFPRDNFPLSFVISSMLLFRSILRFGSTVMTKDWKKKEGVEVWNEIPPRILDEIVYFHLNEMNEIAREKSSWWMIFHTAWSIRTYPIKEKIFLLLNEKRFYSCAKDASFSIYIFVLNDRQCPFAI